MKEMIRLDGITKVYNPGDVTEMCLFSDFSLSVDEGSFVSVVGSNGSGKTSMLNIICGSIPVDSGRVIIDGVDVTHTPEHMRYAKIGRVWQNPATGTCADLTILENMALADCGPAAGRTAHGRHGAKCRRLVLRAACRPRGWNITVNSLPRCIWGLRISLSRGPVRLRAVSGRRWRL